MGDIEQNKRLVREFYDLFYNERLMELARERGVVQGRKMRVDTTVVGCEGRISALKRRHGLNRCRYRGFQGMQRWAGLGVIADNIIQIGRCLALQRA